SYPDAYPDGYAVAVKSLQAEIRDSTGNVFRILSGLTFLVALIASANVASLNLANLAVRHQELAIREAVGASPGRIIRQVMTEQLLLVGVGCGVALLVAYPALRLLQGFAAELTPLASGIGMDAAAIGFALLVAVLMWLLSVA